jgi:hypothetical protein
MHASDLMCQIPDAGTGPIGFDATLVKMENHEDSGWKPIGSGSRLLVGELVPGTRLKIIGWIGEGSMGQVFEALHVDIHRRVALKVQRAAFERSPEMSTLFVNEAKACARVESRFVVGVMDSGELPDHRPYFVMELLGREDLHSALKDRRMSLGRALPILRQCCKALVAIHEAGLVHRDIKPNNVILQREDGRADAVRVVDFGLAVEPGVTARISGTASYMAPEQITGEPFDGRLDIYALGCMAYVMLAGRAPFLGTLEQLLEAHKSTVPVPISALCPDLPAALDPILGRCLEKRKDLRWPNPHELEAALLELQIALDIVTPWDDLPLPMVGEQRRAQLAHGMARRNRRSWWRSWWIVSAGLGATLVLGGAVGLTLADRAGEHAEVVVPADGPDDSQIEHLTNQTRLAASKAYWVYPPELGQATALSWIGVLEETQGELAVPARVRAAELRGEIADTLSRLGDRYWDEEHGRTFALEFYALALVFVPDDPHALERSPLTPTQLADLIERAERGEFSAAELRVAKLMEVLADPNDERRRARLITMAETDSGALPWYASEQLIALSGAQLATRGASNGPRDADEQTGNAANEPADPHERRDPPKATALVTQARAATGGGRRSEARRLFNEALALDSASVDALSGLAELHFESGEYSKALGFARRASRLRPREGELHILVGDCYLKSMRYAEARGAYEAAAKLGHAAAGGRLAKLDGLLE